MDIAFIVWGRFLPISVGICSLFMRIIDHSATRGAMGLANKVLQSRKAGICFHMLHKLDSFL